MNAPVTFKTCLQPVDQALSRLPGVSGEHFTERAASAISVLPEELAQPLRELLALYQQVQAQPAPDGQLGLEFCFACGALTEKLRAELQARMEVESAIVGPGTVSAQPLQGAQSDQLSRFIEARDRLFRKTADLTLKFLLIGLGLLTLGLLLGVI